MPNEFGAAQAPWGKSLHPWGKSLHPLERIAPGGEYPRAEGSHSCAEEKHWKTALTSTLLTGGVTWKFSWILKRHAICTEWLADCLRSRSSCGARVHSRVIPVVHPNPQAKKLSMDTTNAMTLLVSSRDWSGTPCSGGIWRPLVRAIVTPIALAVASVIASSATATLINVDFNSSGPGTSVGTFAGTGILGGGTWNGVTVNQNAQALATTSLLDSTGAASGISVTIPAYQGAWNFASQPPSSWKPLMGDYLYVTAAGQSTATINLSGLGSSTAWDLVFYSASGQGEGSNFTIGATTKQTTDSGGIGATLTVGDEYVVFNNIVSSGSGTISIAWENYGTPGSVLNGLQIQSVPEPSSVFLVSSAALCGAAACRVRSRSRASRAGR